MRARVPPYRLPLVRPVRLGAQTFDARDGLLLRLEADGHVGWGDAAPLPGFSCETLAEAEAALARFADALARGATPAEAGAGLPPSAAFAVDLARADLRARTEQRALNETVAESVGQPHAKMGTVALPLAGLILDGDAPSQARALAEAGYVAVKLKVGRAAVADDAAAVRAVREALPPYVALRLDANRAWSGDDARRFAEAIDGTDISFIEEPLVGGTRDALHDLWRETGLQVALDESLASYAPGQTDLTGGWLAAAVVKPTVIGGASRLGPLFRDLKAAGVPAVLSGAFESGVGMRGVAALALATGSEPAGLDPYRLLATDVFDRRLPLAAPLVDACALFDPTREVVLP